MSNNTEFAIIKTAKIRWAERAGLQVTLSFGMNQAVKCQEQIWAFDDLSFWTNATAHDFHFKVISAVLKVAEVDDWDDLPGRPVVLTFDKSPRETKLGERVPRVTEIHSVCGTKALVVDELL